MNLPTKKQAEQNDSGREWLIVGFYFLISSLIIFILFRIIKSNKDLQQFDNQAQEALVKDLSSLISQLNSIVKSINIDSNQLIEYNPCSSKISYLRDSFFVSPEMLKDLIKFRKQCDLCANSTDLNSNIFKNLIKEADELIKKIIEIYECGGYFKDTIRWARSKL